MQMQPNSPAPQGQPSPQGEMTNPAGEYDDDIVAGLEEHLNQIPDDQKQFLANALQNNADIVIPVLGIVAGKEVFDYFTQVYEQYFGNSAQGQPQATSQPSAGPKMAPMSMPTEQQAFNPQAKATPPMM